MIGSAAVTHRPRPPGEARFRAPTPLVPSWSRHALDRLVLTSDESGSFQAYAWDRAAGTRRRVTDEHVGVIYATVSADGSRAIWFADPSGDESGRVAGGTVRWW